MADKPEFSHLKGHVLISGPTEQKRYVAFHEAGHATIACVLELSLEYATINIPALYALRLEGLTKLSGEFDCDDSQKKLKFYLAGVTAAHRMRTGKLNPDGIELLEEASQTGARDLQMMEDEITLCKMVNEDLPDNIVEQTVHLVNMYWLLVEKVAARLLEVGTITGDEVQQLRSELF